ncbi:Ig-like domain-containing protein [Aeromonas lacus]|uniref:Ig-like domain-containing protein n=1 Tax=Aeromonas lacus TaxID=558884 RepID=UPI00051B23E3|nr:Ig-like domain-containing protein [Aeromonas lacus]
MITTANFTAENGAIADGTRANAVSAKVTDGKNNPIKDMDVTFTVKTGDAQFGSMTGGTTIVQRTDSNGIATTSLVSPKAGSNTLTAKVAENTPIETTSIFVADSGTADIATGDLRVVRNNSLPTGSHANVIAARVTDAGGNPVKSIDVFFNATVGTLSASSVNTGELGVALVELTSTVSGVSTVTAKVNGKTYSIDSAFATPSIAEIVIKDDKNNSVADGSAENEVQVRVLTETEDPVASTPVSFSVSNGEIVGTADAVTDAAGYASVAFTSTVAGPSEVKAKLTLNGVERRIITTFIGDPATAELLEDNVEVAVTGQPANGTAANEVHAKITDGNGNPVQGVKVRFSANNGGLLANKDASEEIATGTNGIAIAKVTNTRAGQTDVSVNFAGKTVVQRTDFVADVSTATITESNLLVTEDEAVADGRSINRVQATVTDANNNLVSGAKVTFSADHGGVVTTVVGTTSADGIATATVTNTLAGVTFVLARVNKTLRSVPTVFIADVTTAKVSTLEAVTNGMLADGITPNSVEALVVDANNNPIKGLEVTFAATNSAVVALEKVKTGENGIAANNITSTIAGVSKVSATINGTTEEVDVTFNALSRILSGDLSVEKDDSVVGTTDENEVVALVSDYKGAPAAGQKVTFTTSDTAAKVRLITDITDENGKVSAFISHTKAGTIKVYATVNGQTEGADTSFRADSANPVIADGALTATSGALANNSATNQVTAIVTDQYGNLLTGIPVAFVADNPTAVLSNSEETTDKDGKAIITVKNSKAGLTVVSATVGDESPKTVDTSFETDVSTATILAGDLKLMTTDPVVANGTDTHVVHAIVKDAGGNLLADQVVAFSTSRAGGETDTAILSKSEVTTDKDGLAIVTLTNIKSGPTQVTAKIKDKEGSWPTITAEFIGDESTATLLDGSLTVRDDNRPADGISKNSVSARVTDVNNNPIAGKKVRFSAGNGAVVDTEVETDGAGYATAFLTNVTAGVTSVTATFNSVARTVNVNFVSDFIGVTVSVGYASGTRYSEVAIAGVHPDGADATTPIVGSVWQAALTCSDSVLAADCQPDRFDYDWKLKVGDEVRAVAGTNGGATYTLNKSDQRGQLLVNITPKSE